MVFGDPAADACRVLIEPIRSVTAFDRSRDAAIFGLAKPDTPYCAGAAHTAIPAPLSQLTC